MRCVCCDWSSTTPSPYYESVILTRTPRHLFEAKDHTFVCDVCLERGYSQDEGDDIILDEEDDE